MAEAPGAGWAAACRPAGKAETAEAHNECKGGGRPAGKLNATEKVDAETVRNLEQERRPQPTKAQTVQTETKQTVRQDQPKPTHRPRYPQVEQSARPQPTAELWPAG